MKNRQTDSFHQLFPDHGEPKLPCSVYNKLLDAMDVNTAFNLLCDYERDLISMSDITRQLALN